MPFKEVDIRDVKESVVKLISDDWALLTAGDEADHNTMTVSWGALGELWGEDVTFVFVRPQRYTLKFIENSACYSLCFFSSEHKDKLKLCGSKSGRDIDKDEAAGLTADFSECAPFYKEAQMVILCEKMAAQDIDPKGFIDKNIMSTYSAGDYHKMFVGAIKKVLVKE